MQESLSKGIHRLFGAHAVFVVAAHLADALGVRRNIKTWLQTCCQGLLVRLGGRMHCGGGPERSCYPQYLFDFQGLPVHLDGARMFNAAAAAPGRY